MPIRLGVPESVAGATLTRRLAWVTAARLAIATLSLGAVALVSLARGFDAGSGTVQAVVVTLATACGLSVVYALLLRTGKRLTWLAAAQLIGDPVLWTVLVYLTGGAASGATSFYGISCLVGAFLMGIGGATIAAVAGATCYVGVVLALYNRWLLPPPDQALELYVLRDEELIYFVVVNLIVLIVVTLLASYLSERLRTAGGRIVEAEERADRAERMAALGRLAAGLAHEIRNPLGSISGSIQLLRANPSLSSEDQQLCDIIQREAARLNDLVSDMMNVAKPRKPSLAVVNVAATARDVVRLASLSGRSSSDVSVVYEGPENVAVRADGGQLRQLIWNLVRNAVQASSAGDRVRVRVLDNAQEGVRLEVQDDGVGLDEQAREQLFDAFFTTRSHGTGMGLAVVKRIADDHGFAIQVDSTAGHGAVFRVCLGARLDETPPPGPATGSSSFPPPRAL